MRHNFNNHIMSLKKYTSKMPLLLMSPVGTIEFINAGNTYEFCTDDIGLQAFIERTGKYRSGGITMHEVKDEQPAKEESPTKVKNAKQAMEWLVKNKGEKRGVYSKEQIRALGKKHGVEFPNWK